jgi:MFS transporter, UMF1 family
MDGLTTLFAVGGIYAAREIGMSFDEIIIFAIGLNVTAGIGAVGFGWLDDWIGPKKTVLISLVCLIVLGSLILVSTDALWFWAFALPLGLFFGPVQSASRSIMARLAPAHLQTEMFGLFALSGKVTAPVGPWVFGAVAALAGGALRPAMATIIVFFVVGLILLWFVRDERI